MMASEIPGDDRQVPGVRRRFASRPSGSHLQGVTASIVETAFDLQGIVAGPSAATEAAGFLRDVAAGMPHALAPGMVTLTALFDVLAVARFGRPFHRLPLAARRRHLLSWRRSRIDAFRSFAKFHETFAMFHHFSAAPQKPADA